MDAYVEPIHIEIRMEQEMYSIKCNDKILELPRADVFDMAAALDRFLDDPKNTEGVPSAFENHLKRQDNVWVTEVTGEIKNGFWSLSCTDGQRFSWATRPTQVHRLTASLRWDDDLKRWFVSGIRLNNIQRR